MEFVVALQTLTAAPDVPVTCETSITSVPPELFPNADATME